MLNLSLGISAEAVMEKKDEMLTYGKVCVGSSLSDISVPLLTAPSEFFSFSFLRSCTAQPAAKIMFYSSVLKAETSLYLTKNQNPVPAPVRLSLMLLVVPWPSSRAACLPVDLPKNISP